LEAEKKSNVIWGRPNSNAVGDLTGRLAIDNAKRERGNSERRDPDNVVRKGNLGGGRGRLPKNLVAADVVKEFCT